MNMLVKMYQSWLFSSVSSVMSQVICRGLSKALLDPYHESVVNRHVCKTRPYKQNINLPYTTLNISNFKNIRSRPRKFPCNNFQTNIVTNIPWIWMSFYLNPPPERHCVKMHCSFNKSFLSVKYVSFVSQNYNRYVKKKYETWSGTCHPWNKWWKIREHDTVCLVLLFLYTGLLIWSVSSDRTVVYYNEKTEEKKIQFALNIKQMDLYWKKLNNIFI